jgi:hypothetical protein
LREISGEESGLNSRKRRGDELNLASHGIGDTDGEEDDTSRVLAVVHNSSELRGLLIVSSISQYNEDLVHSRSCKGTSTSDG